MSITAFLRANAGNYPDKESLTLACMEATGAKRSKVIQAFVDIRTGKTPIVIGMTGTPQPTNTTFKGLSEADIRAKHDTRFILSQIVKKLEKGLYVTDTDFIKQCDIKNHSGFRQILDDPDFRMYHGKAQGITYWSHPDSISKMKTEGILT